MPQEAIGLTQEGGDTAVRPEPRGWLGHAAILSAMLLGLWLMGDAIGHSSATYDEVAYLRVGAKWWRTGDQEAITRMGSPLTFWKLQQIPVLWVLDHLGLGYLIDDPISHQAVLLPLIRLGSLWIWMVAMATTTVWARLLYGPRAMVCAAWLFTLSPNLLAHGAIATMEMPLVACSTGVFFSFWRFLQTQDCRFFVFAALLSGLAFSCKFTTVVIPLALVIVWWLDQTGSCERGWIPVSRRVALGMTAFVILLLASDLVVTGFATLPLSESTGTHPMIESRFGSMASRWLARLVEVPIPQDWVGLAIQVRHQRSGGPSYLLGERRLHGWWYYYFVALAVKVPLSFWGLTLGRAVWSRRVRSTARDGILTIVPLVFLALAALGSSRNYGIRYLLPLAPLAIVWVSALAEGSRAMRWFVVAMLVGQGLSVASIHPFELSYFNAIAGGSLGGRRILSDSNLDWGQGARELARLQSRHPEFRDLTLFYFGNTDPGHYGVLGHRIVVDAGTCHPDLPPRLEVSTAFLGVSASLQHGPWGPPDYFRALDGLRPVAQTDDGTIAIYRAADLSSVSALRQRTEASPSQTP